MANSRPSSELHGHGSSQSRHERTPETTLVFAPVPLRPGPPELRPPASLLHRESPVHFPLVIGATLRRLYREARGKLTSVLLPRHNPATSFHGCHAHPLQAPSLSPMVYLAPSMGVHRSGLWESIGAAPCFPLSVAAASPKFVERGSALTRNPGFLSSVATWSVPD
jgi:hypothetical protein